MAGISSQAMEPSVPAGDVKTQLLQHLIACNSQRFNKNWQEYQAAMQKADLENTQESLTQLATQLRAHKDQERAAKLNGTLKRIVKCGLKTVPEILCFIICGCLEFAALNYEYKVENLSIRYALQRKNFNMFKAACLGHTALITSILISVYSILQHINDTRFAGTEQLNKDIIALDEILVYLNTVQSAEHNN